MTAERSARWKIVTDACLPTAFLANTAGRAVRRLAPHPVRLTVRKGIPPASGLGSSAASAAAAVVAVDRLFALGLPPAELVRWAALGELASAGSAHGDNVAAAILGGFAICTRDFHVAALPVSAALRLAIVVPDLRVTTRTARAVLPRSIPLARHADSAARAALIADAIRRGDAEAMGRWFAGSLVDRARSRLVRGFAGVVRAAIRAGATGVTLSGSGPSILAAGGDPRAVGRAMAAAFRRAGVAARPFVASPARGARVVEAR